MELIGQEVWDAYAENSYILDTIKYENPRINIIVLFLNIIIEWITDNKARTRESQNIITLYTNFEMCDVRCRHI